MSDAAGMPLSVVLVFSTLTGAGIGFLACRIACGLLCRPSFTSTCRGGRLPFLSGFARRRRQLAADIGALVVDQLPTPASLRLALQSERFKKALCRLVEERLGVFLAKDRGALAQELPGGCEPFLRLGARFAGRRVTGILLAFLRSDKGESLSRAFIEAQLQVLRRRRQGGLSMFGGRTETCIRSLVADFLAEENIRTAISAVAAGRLQELRRETRSLGQMLPAGFEVFVHELADRAAPWILDQALLMAAAPELRRSVAQGMGRVVQDFIQGLGPLGAIAGGFFTREGLEIKIAGFLDGQWEKMSALLTAAGVEKKIRDFLGSQIESLLNRPVAAVLAQLPEEKQDAAVALGTAQIVAILRQPESTAACVRLLEETLHKRLDDDSVARLGQAFSHELRLLLSSPQARRLVAEATAFALETTIGRRPIGPLHACHPEGGRRALSLYLQETVFDILQKELPAFLATLDLRGMVAEKVDRLDSSRLRSLFMPVLREQTAVFTSLGALFGLLLGLVNGLLFLLL